LHINENIEKPIYCKIRISNLAADNCYQFRVLITKKLFTGKAASISSKAGNKLTTILQKQSNE